MNSSTDRPLAEQSFMKALFFGVIAEEVVFPYPQIGQSERDRIHELIEAIGPLLDEEPSGQKLDHEAVIDDALIARLRELGAFGLLIPIEYGGSGLTMSGFCRVLQEIAGKSPSVALFLHVHQAVVARGIATFGSPEQRSRFLPRLASGELIGAFALTEHLAGSDAGTIRTLALVDDEAQNYRLSGEKRWVTGAAIASLFLVFARTNPAIEGSKPHLVALLVERGPGVEVGPRHETLGMRGVPICSLGLKDVVVPEANLLGERGKGFKVAMAILNDARIALCAAMTGQARRVMDIIVPRLAKRRSFGRVIGEFPVLKEKIAKMLCDVYAIESMTYLTAGMCDRGVDDYSLESAICRVATTEALWRVVNEAMQAAAGSGYDASQPLERFLRDARAWFVLDGTNETLRCFIALAGMRGPGQRMSAVQGAMYEPIKGFGLLRDFAVRKVREALRRERLTGSHPLLDREAVTFEEDADDLARAVDRALREHGTEIAEMQQVLLRVANVSIDLYALAACLSRTSLVIEQRGEAGARRHLDLTIMFAAAARSRIRGNLDRLEHNDDELRKLIASRTYTDGGYPFDVL